MARQKQKGTRVHGRGLATTTRHAPGESRRNDLGRRTTANRNVRKLRVPADRRIQSQG